MAKKEKNRVSDRRYHYTYLITDHINNKYYYGVHSTDHNPEDIKQYHGSSTYLNDAINTFGIENFSKQVRRYFNTRVEAGIWECKVLSRLHVRSRKDFYNKSEGGFGFDATGYVTVRSLTTGKVFSVPVDDPYIGIHYTYETQGRSCKQEVKELLSSLYKGKKWVGEDNPVYKLKGTKDWHLALSKSLEGKSLPTPQRDALKDPKHWGHLKFCVRSKEALRRANFHRTINNAKYRWAYLYNGSVYIRPSELKDHSGNKVTIKNRKVLIVEEHQPLIMILVADGIGFPDVKQAAKSLKVHVNTISARIKNIHRDDYYYRDEATIQQEKNESLKHFVADLRVKYKDILDEQLKECMK